jgi:uncharacterized protein involved in outer membrane biogenesis
MSLGRKSRRVLIALLVLIVLAGVGWLALPFILEPVIRAKLGAIAEAHLKARLLIGRIDYSFPYGVRVHKVRLKRLADDSELFAAPLIELALLELPIDSRTLQIERIIIDQPTLRLVRQAVLPPATAPSATAAPTAPSQPRTDPPPDVVKLSDLFRLRVLSISGARIEYEDRRAPDAPPLVWDNINTDLRLTPRTASEYGWAFTADSGAAADVAASGAIDIDRLVVDVAQLAINARADTDGAAALPARLRQFLQHAGASGAVRLEAAGQVLLRHFDVPRFNSKIHLDDAQATVQGQLVRADVVIAASKQPDQPRVHISVPAFQARVGQGTLDVMRAVAEIDPRTGSWRMTELAAGLHDIAFTPPGFGQPIEQISGAIQLNGDQLVLQNLTGQVERDQLSLAQARGQLTTDGGIELRDIDLAVTFARPLAGYPANLRRILSPLDPSGPYSARGRFAVYGSRRQDYDLVIATNAGELRIGSKHVALTNVRGQAQVTPGRVVVRRLLASAFDGAVAATATFDLSQTPLQYSGELSLRDLDVSAMGAAFSASADKPTRLSGRCDASFALKGQGSSADALLANGELSITQGQLWEVPLLERIVSRVKLAREALTAGEAAAVFDIADAKVQLRRAALNSPALGLHGSGVVGFDGELDLMVTAAPLGDWERHIKKTGLPLVSDLAGNFAGGVQRLISAATNELLFQFKVTGPAADPKVDAIPSPILTESTAHVLARMIRRDSNLLQALKEKPK